MHFKNLNDPVSLSCFDSIFSPSTSAHSVKNHLGDSTTRASDHPMTVTYFSPVCAITLPLHVVLAATPHRWATFPWLGLHARHAAIFGCYFPIPGSSEWQELWSLGAVSMFSDLASPWPMKKWERKGRDIVACELNDEKDGHLLKLKPTAERDAPWKAMFKSAATSFYCQLLCTLMAPLF